MLYINTYMWNLKKKWYRRYYLQSRWRHRHREQRYGGGGEGGGMNQKMGIDIYTLLILCME